MSETRQSQPEIVYTTTSYYDGIRSGIADYLGAPHVFESLFDEDDENDVSSGFLLQPIDEQTFRLAMEDWAIWTRWEHAFRAGRTPSATHPALPEDRSRHTELAEILGPRLTIAPDTAIHARGRFEVRQAGQAPISSSFRHVVYWTPYDRTDGI